MTGKYRFIFACAVLFLSPAAAFAGGAAAAIPPAAAPATSPVTGGAAKAPIDASGAKAPADASGAKAPAMEGYDPVAYFADGHPEKGSAQFQYRWQGETFRFASADHRDAFKNDPQHYAPQYGGYSAYDVYLGRIADADPAFWSIYDGRLYLNASENDRRQWLADLVGYIESADSKWAKLKPGATQ